MEYDLHSFFGPDEEYDEKEAQIRLRLRQQLDRDAERFKAEQAAKAAAGAAPAPAQKENSVTELPNFLNSPKPAESADFLASLPISLLDDFPKDKHPFRPYTKDERAALAEDISQNGVLQPLIVRPKQGGRYEIIAGHNRRDAASDVGYKEISCVVRQLDDDEALIQMISTNLKQRTGLLPSEKAWAYKYQLDAMKRQGRRTDLWDTSTSAQIEPKLRSNEELASRCEDSRAQIQRYIRLTFLRKELLDLVDEGRLPFIVGVTLSYLSPTSQRVVHNFFFEQRTYPVTQNIADRLREMEKAGTLDEQSLEAAFLATHATKQLKAVKVPLKKWKNRIDPEASEKDVVEMCEGAVDVFLDCRDEYFDKDADPQMVVDAIKEAMEAKYGKSGKKGGRKK